MKKKYFKYSSLSLAILSILSTEANAAANFTVSPITSFPAQNTATGVLPVYFTIKNNTNSTRSGYSIVGLPANVSQGTGTGYCSNPITLTANASCTLQLNVTGTVGSASFALCKGSSCTTANAPMSVELLTQSILVAVGQDYTASINTPLLAQSTDQGSTWSYATLPSTLPFGTTGVLRSATCIGSTCLAVGEDEDAGSNPMKSLIAYTYNNGQDWVYSEDVPTLSTNSFEGLYSISRVSDATYVAVGVSERGPNSPPAKTWIIRSTDSGRSWQLPTSYTTVFGYFNSVSCSGLTCIAAGYYNTGNSPTLALSSNGGVSWSNIVSSSGVVASAELYSASCNGNTCVVVGQDTSDHTPLVGLSTNNGASWTWSNGGGTPYSGGYLGVKCTELACIAVGFAKQNSGDHTSPAVTVSTNGGTWVPTFYTQIGSSDYAFKSVSCNNSVCVAAGDDGSGTSGIISQAQANGQGWGDASLVTLPNSGLNTIYNSINCNIGACFAAGQDTTGSTPFITQSISGGSWTNPTLPTSVTSGIFNGTGSAG